MGTRRLSYPSQYLLEDILISDVVAKRCGLKRIQRSHAGLRHDVSVFEERGHNQILVNGIDVCAKVNQWPLEWIGRVDLNSPPAQRLEEVHPDGVGGIPMNHRHGSLGALQLSKNDFALKSVACFDGGVGIIRKVSKGVGSASRRDDGFAIRSCVAEGRERKVGAETTSKLVRTLASCIVKSSLLSVVDWIRV